MSLDGGWVFSTVSIISINSSIILNIFLLDLHLLDSNLFLFPFHMTFGINRIQSTNFGYMKEEYLLFIPPNQACIAYFFPADAFFQMVASQNHPLVTSQSTLWPFLSVRAMVPQNCQPYLRKRVDASSIVVYQSSVNRVQPLQRVNQAVSIKQVTIARAQLSAGPLSAPVWISKPSSTAEYAQQTTKTFTLCFMFFLACIVQI